MPDNILEDTYNDLARKYNTTFVCYATNARKEVMQVGSVLEDLSFKGIPVGKTKSVQVPAASIDVSWPELGVVNAGKTAMYFTRRATRTSLRGFVFENVVAEHILPETCAFAAIEDPMLTDKNGIINELFFPKYQSVADTYNSILSGECVARAFNNKYWIGINPFCENPVLGYKTWTVGTMLSDRSVKLHKKAVALKEDISMYLEVQ